MPLQIQLATIHHGSRRESSDGGVQVQGPFRAEIASSDLELKLLRLLAREAGEDDAPSLDADGYSNRAAAGGGGPRGVRGLSSRL